MGFEKFSSKLFIRNKSHFVRGNYSKALRKVVHIQRVTPSDTLAYMHYSAFCYIGV